LYTFNGVGEDWSPLALRAERMPPLPDSGYNRVVGRPTLAWVAPPIPQVSLGAEPSPLFTYGRLYVVYSHESDPASTLYTRDHVRMAISYVNPATGSLEIGLDSPFDNRSSYAYGIDLLQPNEIALRAAETYAIKNVLRKVFVRPHADGISDLSYSNIDDWKVLAWGSCDSLMVERPNAMKVTCPAPTW
jgi:hypothetical protein